MNAPADSYTGDVKTGGAADVRRTPALEISKVSVGPMENNAYLLRCTATGDGLIVDAANDGETLIELVRSTLGSGILSTVVTTHQHGDHWQALEMVTGMTGAQALAHPLDAPGLPIPTDPIEHGGTVTVGDVSLDVIHLRGHTPGSVALHWRDPAGIGHLFTGDSLFPGGPGATRGNAENFTSLVNDLQERIFDVLPDDTWFYPGHGKDSTLGAERPHLAEWRARGW